MENEIVTPEGQDTPNVGFDEYGELKFSEKGLEGFKELLKEGVKEDVRPTADEPEPELEEHEPPKAEPAKKKLKVGGQEFEATEDELIQYAQMGADYTRKTQQLAEERNALAPYEALITQLKRDPGLSQHLAKYWQQPQQPQAQAPKFEDPIEQLKWETKQETIAEVRREMQQALQQTVTPLHRQAALNQVKQQVMQDPDYQEVHGSIIAMVQAMPPSVQKNMYLQLDQDPRSYLEAFQAQKQRLMAARQNRPQQVIDPVGKRVERAPILESSNSAPSADEVKSQKAKIDKAKAKVLREGSVEALQSFLETGGFLEHLK